MLKFAWILVITVFLVSCSGIIPRYHRAQGGETLVELAKKYEVPVSELEAANRVPAKEALKKGQKVYIPFEENPEFNGVEIRKALVKEGASDENAPDVADGTYDIPLVRYIWPVKGSVSSQFGRRRGKFHEGVDIVARQGTPVRASRSGHVIYASNGISGYGNLVILKHTDNYATVYAHLSKFKVAKGQFISKGSVLGNVGMTGHASSPHLHFEIRQGQIPINPLQYLQGTTLAKNSRR